MASSIASDDYLKDTLKLLEISIPKPTAIDKIGGILCHICDTIFGNKKEYDTHYTQHKLEGTETVYTCVVCKKQISGYPSFRGHCYLNHVVKNKFQCNRCSKSFSKLSILNSHISTVHNFKCNKCDDKFLTKEGLEKHKAIHAKNVKGGKGEPPYDCLLCGEVLKTLDSSEKHIEEHCEIHYPCPICEEVLLTKLEATKHLTKHFDENLSDISTTPMAFTADCSIKILGGILCCYCNMLFQNRSEIDSHFSTEHEDKGFVYSCNICNKQFEKYEMFGRHCYDSHIAKDKFQCDQCNRTFHRLSLLVIHTEKMHSNSSADKPFSCELCAYSSITSYCLQVHMRIVHEEMLRCMEPGCTAQFEKPKDLILHMKNHKAYLDNWCRQCGLQFSTLSSAERHLDVHRRMHFTCPVCLHTYREKYLLVKHVPRHFEAVLHVCRLCGKSYAVRRRFIHHLKTHAEARMYPCTICSKSFMKPFELKQHLNMHTGRKPYACTLCPKMFANYPNWSKHLNRIHNIEKDSIKQLHTERVPAAEPEPEPELYVFVPPDDPPAPAEPWASAPSPERENSDDLASMTDTVNAVIDRMDSWDADLDMVASKVDMKEINLTESEFSSGNLLDDDASDITAIVEHIEAMSGEMEAAAAVDSQPNVSHLAPADDGVLQYANMMPITSDAVFNPNVVHSSLPQLMYYHQPPSSCPAEYGPSFPSAEGLPCDSLLNPDDHMLPHIDPLLTIRAEDNAKMYLQNLNNYNFENVPTPNYETQNVWAPPIITKLFHYDDNADANRMYIC